MQLEAAIEAVIAGASYETAEQLTGVARSTVRDYVVRRGLLGRSVPRPGRRRAGESSPSEEVAAAHDRTAAELGVGELSELAALADLLAPYLEPDEEEAA